MSEELVGILIGAAVAILVYLHHLYRDMSALRDRISTMEGEIKGVKDSADAFSGNVDTLKKVVIESIRRTHGAGDQP